MGLVQLVVLVKLKLLFSTSHAISLTPFITYLVAPFVLKVLLNWRSLPQLYEDVWHASRLLIFQFSEIAFGIRQENLEDRSRWERALRLFSERISHSLRSPSSTEARSMHDFSMITLWWASAMSMIMRMCT